MAERRTAEHDDAAVGSSRPRSRVSCALVAGLFLTSCAPDPDSPVAGFRVEETTIADIHAAFRAGTFTCTELVTMYLDRIRAYDKNGPAINAITTVNPRALDEAAALDERWQRGGSSGPLHCVPVLLKDNINTTDMPTTSGSAILRNTTALDDAAVVKRLENAGALILGKAGMGELAAGGYNTVHGQQLNPYDTSVTMAGSSSGSGASVAANLTAVAIGTDTYTSVRSPAAATSIVGIRPTTGLISRNGISPRKAGIDTAGPMARSVTDAVIVLNVLAGPDPADPRSLDVHASYPAAAKTATGYADFTQYLAPGALRGARIGVAEDFFGSDPEIDALARAAVARMQELGAELVEVRFDPDFFERYVRGWVENLDEVLVWGFREQWEAYLKTLQPGIPGTVAEWVRIYENELTSYAIPARHGTHERAADAQSLARAFVDRSGVRGDDRANVADDHANEARDVRQARRRRARVPVSGATEPGRPWRLRLRGLSDDRRADGFRRKRDAGRNHVHGSAVRRGQADRLRLRLRAGHEAAPPVAVDPAARSGDVRSVSRSAGS